MSLLASAMHTTPKVKDVTTQNAHTSTPVPAATVNIQTSCNATHNNPAVTDLHSITGDMTTTDVTSPRIRTPVNPKALSKLLSGYPRRQHIIDGITNGFTLHFEGPEAPLEANNSPSLLANISVAREKIKQELALGRIAGPFTHPPFNNFKTSPLALREKATPGKFRLLHNLSYPYDNNSVNFNIPKHHTTVKYQTINHAISWIQHHSPQAYLAKSDISDAFRIIPVHPSQYHLLGFRLDNKYYHDKMLGMGASPSCRIFEDFSDAILWILHHHRSQSPR